MRVNQRGFSVVEMLLATMLVVAIGLGALGAIRFLVRALDARSSGQGGTVAVEQQLNALRAQAATAFAVFVPLRDVFGHPNVPAGVGPGAPASAFVGHEVDFYGRTETGAETYWAYYFDASKRTLERYDYDAAGRTGVADRESGAISAGKYPPLTGVANFSAQRFEANELASSANEFAPLVAGLVAVSGAPDADPVGFLPAAGAPHGDLYGGNTTVALKLVTDRGTRSVHLGTAALPAGFTIHAAPAIRALVYRVNTVHRSWLGFVQKTHAQIFEQLQYSYHPATDLPNQWKVWCDFELYGSGIAGLTLSDPNVVYHPENYLESTANVYYTVTHGAYADLNPSAQCSPRVPEPTQSDPPAVAATSDPDIVDTPPPCFAAGACWPANAPPNWTPPSPWPRESPPPEWCATHGPSPLCGGPGGTPVPIAGPLPTPNFSPPGAGVTPIPSEREGG